MNELALFAGAGGGILGGKLLGWRTVCAVEWEQYPASVLCARQNDKILPPFPIWDDVQTFDGKPWSGIVDVVSGGFPCQDISSAGGGAGITGSKSGLWKEMARIIGEVRPKYAFIENSPMLTIRGLETVLCDLAALGFDAKWGVVSAADVGAPHRRERIWIVAHAMRDGLKRDNDRNAGAMGNQKQRKESQESETWRSTEVFEISGYLAHSNLQHDQRRGQPCKPISSGGETWTELNGGRSNVAYSDSAQRKGNECAERGVEERADISKPRWWASEPDVGRVANGVALRVDRLKAIGNGQVPAVAAAAFRLLSEGL